MAGSSLCTNYICTYVRKFTFFMNNTPTHVLLAPTHPHTHTRWYPVHSHLFQTLMVLELAPLIHGWKQQVRKGQVIFKWPGTVTHLLYIPLQRPSALWGTQITSITNEDYWIISLAQPSHSKASHLTGPTLTQTEVQSMSSLPLASNPHL